MAASSINHQTKDIINGYIKVIQKSLAWKEYSYFTIPPSINHICLIYYIPSSFNRKKHVSNIEFIDDNTIQKINNNQHSICTFGEPIYKSMCSIFTIEFKVKSAKSDFCPYIGFFFSSSLSFDKMKNMQYVEYFNDYLGSHNNKQYSFGVTMYNKEHSLFLFDKNNADDGQRLGSNDIYLTFQIGDKVMFKHNFVKSECNIYYNQQKIDTLEIKETFIMPAFSLYFSGVTIEITKYQLQH